MGLPAACSTAPGHTPAWPQIPSDSAPPANLAALPCPPAVWDRLEAENPEFFAAYGSKLAALERLRGLQLAA